MSSRQTGSQKRTRSTTERGVFMSGTTLEFRQEGAAAWLRLNRPTQLNALNGALIDELTQAVRRIKRDPSIHMFLISGAPRPDGRPCFSAGDDLKEAEAGNLPPGNPGFRLTNLIDDLWKPSIAVIDGVCTTGALEIAMACDLRIAAESAQISDWHLKRLGSGLGGWGASTRLPRLIGLPAAKDMILTGRVIDGLEAFRLGLANRVVPSHRLDAEATEMAAAISAMRPEGVRSTMAHLSRTMDLSKDESLGLAKQVREWLDPERNFAGVANAALAASRTLPADRE
jgi:enoyl-CoA hydratase